MQRWVGKIAVVTGASAGIGAATVKEFAKRGIVAVGLARRIERIEEIKKDLGEHGKLVHAIQCDVADEKSVKQAFKTIEQNIGLTNILINNAGMAKNRLLLSDDESNEDFKAVINVNVLGLVYCTRLAYQHLIKSDDYGYIININSVVGHKVPQIPGIQPLFNIYPSSKHAVTATTEVIRQELTYSKTNKIRVTSISPGVVRTEFLTAANAEFLNSPDFAGLIPEDVVDGITYVLSTPDRVQVAELILKPVGEQF